ncbi:hypothetical protein K438DRAFT_1789476 [Mycena galopus ATCC 62051]|nr:hypothetical protein K438DRAFT_1789476 [Mycena galopus ATCC 62051]
MTTNEEKIELYDSWTLERRAEEHQRDIDYAMRWSSDPTATYNVGTGQLPRASPRKKFAFVLCGKLPQILGGLNEASLCTSLRMVLLNMASAQQFPYYSDRQVGTIHRALRGVLLVRVPGEVSMADDRPRDEEGFGCGYRGMSLLQSPFIHSKPIWGQIFKWKNTKLISARFFPPLAFRRKPDSDEFVFYSCPILEPREQAEHPHPQEKTIAGTVINWLHRNLWAMVDELETAYLVRSRYSGIICGVSVGYMVRDSVYTARFSKIVNSHSTRPQFWKLRANSRYRNSGVLSDGEETGAVISYTESPIQSIERAPGDQKLFQCWDLPIKGVPENLCSSVNLSTTGEIVSSISLVTLEPFPIKWPPMGHCSYRYGFPEKKCGGSIISFPVFALKALNQVWPAFKALESTFSQSNVEHLQIFYCF